MLPANQTIRDKPITFAAKTVNKSSIRIRSSMRNREPKALADNPS